MKNIQISPSILSAEEIKKYNPRPLSDVVKLSSNENPYGPSERVRNAIVDSFEDACRYPYEYILELQNILAKKPSYRYLSIKYHSIRHSLR